MGSTPPGTIVSLNNGETAIVTERTEDTVSPKVLSICDAFGEILHCPKHRDTRIRTFNIGNVTEFDWSRHLNVDQIWDSGSEDICYNSLFRFEDPEYL